MLTTVWKGPKVQEQSNPSTGLTCGQREKMDTTLGVAEGAMRACLGHSEWCSQVISGWGRSMLGGSSADGLHLLQTLRSQCLRDLKLALAADLCNEYPCQPIIQ